MVYTLRDLLSITDEAEFNAALERLDPNDNDLDLVAEVEFQRTRFRTGKVEVTYYKE